MASTTAQGSYDVAAKPQMTLRIMDALSGRWRIVPVLVVLVLIWVLFAVLNPVFISPRNISNLSLQIVVTTIIALGLLFVLLIGELDLAVAVTAAVSATVAATLVSRFGLPWPITFAAAIGTGLVIGLLQGIIVTAFRAPAFIVTLGVSLALQGVLLVILPTSGTISLISTDIAALSTTYLQAEHGWVGLAVALAAFAALRVRSLRGRARHGLPANAVSIVVLPVLAVAIAGGAMVTMMNSYRGVPLPIALLFLLLAALAYVTTQTRFGLYLFAIGANQEAARRAGIPVSRIRLAAFALAGALSALAGMLAASRVMAVSANSADTTLLLEAVAAAVIGGATLFGGRGSVWSALIGALVMGSITNGMLLINADTYLRLMVQGTILVLAVVLDASIAKRSRTTR
jgi:D-xylose transport system permease protein